MSSHLTEHLNDAESFKQFQQEALLFEVASLLNSVMKAKGVSRKELGHRLGVTKGRISQYLGGENNLRLRTLADLFTALDCQFKVAAEDLRSDFRWDFSDVYWQCGGLLQPSTLKWQVPEESGRDVAPCLGLAG